MLWQRLGGPLTYEQPATDTRDVAHYLATLAAVDARQGLDDWHEFFNVLEATRTEGDPPDPDVRLDILTMHGAKGLEWDWGCLARPAARTAIGERSASALAAFRQR